MTIILGKDSIFSAKSKDDDMCESSDFRQFVFNFFIHGGHIKINWVVERILRKLFVGLSRLSVATFYDQIIEKNGSDYCNF